MATKVTCTCDRCGKVIPNGHGFIYDEETGKSKPTEDDFFAVTTESDLHTFRGPYKVPGGPSRYTHYDLCKDCFEEVNKAILDSMDMSEKSEETTDESAEESDLEQAIDKLKKDLKLNLTDIFISSISSIYGTPKKDT